jgi:hypothetical protein
VVEKAWHLDRVLKVWHLGVGAAAAKMPPDRCWGKGKETHAGWPERLRQILGYLERVLRCGCLRDMGAVQSIKKQETEISRR